MSFEHVKKMYALECTEESLRDLIKMQVQSVWGRPKDSSFLNISGNADVAS